MRLAAELRERAGVSEAAALMGTPANHALLAAAGLACPELWSAAPRDLMIALDASTETAAEESAHRGQGFFEHRRQQREADGRVSPRTIEPRSASCPGPTWLSSPCPAPTPSSRP